MKHFFTVQNRLIKNTPIKFKRFLYPKINFNNRLVGVVGPRGAGKTTLLLQYLKENNLLAEENLYVSMDDIYFAKTKLYEFAEQFINEYDGKLLILDEVHKYPGWNQELKNIYDSYPNLKIIISGSSSLDLIKGNYDLSRRGIFYNLPGLSFREYLQFSKGLEFDVCSLSDLSNKHLTIAKKVSSKITPLREFKEYLKVGYYPYHTETNKSEYFQKVVHTIEKTIQLDISRFYSIKSNYLQYFYKIIDFLATIPPGEISTNNLARGLGIANETVFEYLEYLRNTSLIRYLYIDARGSKLIRNAAKVFLDNTNLLYAVDYSLDKSVDKGQLRELFFINQLQNSGFIPHFIKRGDVQVKNFKFEIGGKNKDWGQLDKKKNNYLVLDEIVTGEKQIIPLYLFGFLY